MVKTVAEMVMPSIPQVRRLFQRLHHRERFRELNRLLQSSQLSPQLLQQQQQRQLRTLLRHASENTPYYRNHLPPEAWQLPLEQLPILEKAALRGHAEEMVDHRVAASEIRIGFTGGSTGTPLRYFYDQHKLELLQAGQYRSFMQCGWQPGEMVVQLWGATQDISPASLQQRWLQWMEASQTIPARQFDETTLQQWYRQLCRTRPAVIRGYPSILSALANYLLDQGLSLPRPPKGCFSTAEVLYPHQREQIEQALQCKLYNQYGSREIPNISCECSHGSQHIFTDLVVVESQPLVDGNHLLVTSLSNYLMPMIRYRIGDQGRLLEAGCACGSPFPRMEMTMCRSNDLLQTSSGEQIHPSWFIHLLDDIEGIEQYQFRQSSQECVTLSIVCDRLSPHTLRESIQKTLEPRIRQKMGPQIQFVVEQLPQIPRNHSGKHRFVCCDLN